MPIRRAKNGRWRYREVVTLPSGLRDRIFGSAPKYNNTRAAAQQAMQDHIARLRSPEAHAPKQEAPTFAIWFHGEFWNEWVIGKKNKPSEQASKRSIYKMHLGPALGDLPLDEIGVQEIAKLRLSLTRKGLGDKRINNVLVVLSKALKYAEKRRLIDAAPDVGLLKVERPSIVCHEFDELARLYEAARELGPMPYAMCLAGGDAGLRIGEIKALDWKRDVDMVARTITVNRQVILGVEGTPKGLTRRAVPMTDRLHAALKALEVVRVGHVFRRPDGTPWTDSTADKVMRFEICPRAKLAENGWHILRHDFGTHAAMFGVGPFRLQSWMGHKRVEETQLYVHFAEDHRRPIPDDVLAAGAAETDPDRRVIAMLGVRGNSVATVNRQNRNAQES